MKLLKKPICLLLILAMVAGLLTVIPMTAGAEDSVSYIDGNGETQTADNVTELTTDSNILTDGWYVVKSDLTFDTRMNAAGDVHLILCSGATLTAHKGITVAKTTGVTRSLTIYGQSKDADTMGALVIDDVNNNYPGIGNYSSVYGHGVITVNGGKITVSGGDYGAGIGGGNGTSSSDVTINGGIVNATGGYGAAGIGGGHQGGCDVTINGGTVNAKSGSGAAAIGSGYQFEGSIDNAASVTINGGTVNATGAGGGAGIGNDRFDGTQGYYPDPSYCLVTITGGSITADGGTTGAGIGGGQSNFATVEITGGIINAKKGSNENSSGIGNGAPLYPSGAGANSDITLSWTDADNDSIYADSFGGKVTLEKYFTDRVSEVYSTGKVTDNSMIGGRTIYPFAPKVKKIWDTGGSDELHPASLKAVLQINRNPDTEPAVWTTAHTVTLNADNEWEAAFDAIQDDGGAQSKRYGFRVRELDKDNNVVDGSKASYTVTQNGKSLQLNYHVTYENDTTRPVKITNKLDVRKLRIEKKWDIDIEGKDHPDSIEVAIQEKKDGKWEDVQIITLNSDNEWKKEVILPKYRYDGDAESEIDYRARELREQTLYSQFMGSIKDLIVSGKDKYDEWTDKLKNEGQKYYNMLPDFVQDAMNESYESLCSALSVADDEVNKLYDRLMELLDDGSGGERIVHDKDDSDKGEKEQTNRVTYNVSSYTSVVSAGEVSSHSTVYKVTYDADGDDITITNQAIQIIDLHKWWIPINVDDDDMPDSAWLVLMVKPSSGAVDNAESIASAAGIDLGGILDYDFPVLDPLEGGMGPFEILGEAVFGIDLSWLDDFFDIPKVGIVKVDEDDKWRSTIIDTKYTMGIPKEFRGAELTGEIIHQVIKYLTDGLVDLPVSYNPFSNYITISTKAIPALRWMSVDDLKDSLSWDKLISLGKSITQQDLDNFKPQDLILDKNKLMANIINIKFSFDVDDDDDDDDNELTVSKIWAGDEESKRPDWIKLHVKNGSEEISGSPITLNKSDFSGQAVWSKKITLPDGVKKKSLTVTEEYPADYEYKDSYAATVLGTVIVNKWSPDSTNINGQKLWVDNNDDAKKRPSEITVNLMADGEKVDSVKVTAANGWRFVFSDQPTYKTEGGSKVKINYTVEEEAVEGYTASYDGFVITNTLNAPTVGKLKITAVRSDADQEKEQSFVYRVTGDSIDLTVGIVLAAGETSGSVTIAQLPAGDYTVTEESAWSWRYPDGGSKTATVSSADAEVAFDHTKDNNDWLNGYAHRSDE